MILIKYKSYLLLLEDGGGGAKKEAKGGTAVKVRHILCEKHGKVMEAMEKLKAGMFKHSISLRNSMTTSS